jgi:hypothetical protein
MQDSQASMSVFHRLIRQVMRDVLPHTKGSLHASVRESIRLRGRFKVIGNVELTPGATQKSGPDPVRLNYPTAVKEFKRTGFCSRAVVFGRSIEQGPAVGRHPPQGRPHWRRQPALSPPF